MDAVGIDIGTGSIRMYHGSQVQYSPITTTHGNKVITQSSFEIYDKVLGLLSISNFQFDSICVCATCSQVVLEKVIIEGATYLTPYHLNDGVESDVLLWMDNSPVAQCEELNRDVVEDDVLQQIGGKFIPELGLPKLKLLNDTVSSELVVFELYDFISYLLKYSHKVVDGKKLTPYIKPQRFKEGYALDGSVKGWSAVFLDKLGIGIEIGRSEVEGDRLLPIGYPVGTMHNRDIVIAHGCIDCYGGWFNNLQLSASNAVSMVAGTSTCFIYNSSTNNYITNTWGPYELSKPGVYVYEFGQPATGKLYEVVLGKEFDFDRAEIEIEEMEKKHGQSIHELVKGYFYYGDVFGNRSPLQDPEMSEMVIDSNNQILPRILHNDDRVSQLIKYVLIMEFLVFQTKSLLELLTVDKLVIVGSQAKNARFLRLLNLMTGIDVEIGDNEAGTDEVARGAFLLARLGKLVSLSHDYTTAFNQVIQQNRAKKVEFAGGKHEKNHTLLTKKYEIFKDMINVQRKYRSLMNG
ncbi:Protein MPA43 [Candida viswanathii]|uniref:Protein MPA43 n=1 Tax=Candida viswanathii TaxID=5486 RepID=A0A367XPM1_9ASCO|nr:Protein MPA43 [Candida viswanathii]